MPATIASVAAPAAAAAPAAPAPTSTAPVQTSAGGEGAKAPGTEAKAPETAAQKQARMKIKAKFDGREEELDLGEDDVVRSVQKVRHFEKTRGEHEKSVADHNRRIEEMTKNPLKYLAERGVDLRKLATEQQQRETELEAMTPEQREAFQAREEARAAQKELNEYRETQKQAADATEHRQLVTETAGTIGKAMEIGGFKRSGESLKLMAEVMELAHRAGEPAMSPEQLATAAQRLELQRVSGMVKRAATDPAWRARNASVFKQMAQTIIPALEGQELVDFLGPANVEKVSLAALAVYKKSPLPIVGSPENTPPPPQTARPAPKANPTGSTYGFLDKLINGG